MLPFVFGRTRYAVTRRREWLFFLHVARGENDVVRFEIDVADLEEPILLSPQGTSSAAVGEGLGFVLIRADKSEEQIVIWAEAIDGERSTIGIEAPDGVEILPVDE